MSAITLLARSLMENLPVSENFIKAFSILEPMLVKAPLTCPAISRDCFCSSSIDCLTPLVQSIEAKLARWASITASYASFPLASAKRPVFCTFSPICPSSLASVSCIRLIWLSSSTVVPSRFALISALAVISARCCVLSLAALTTSRAAVFSLRSLCIVSSCASYFAVVPAIASC